MIYSIEDHLSDVLLQPRDRVELVLHAMQTDLTESRAQVLGPFHRRPGYYDFSIKMKVEERKYEFPLAKVRKAHRAGIAYGTKEEELGDVSKAVRDLGFSRGSVLGGFFEVAPLGLEAGMSSDSVLYVFSGLVRYAAAIGEKMGLCDSDTIILGGREVSFEEVARLQDVLWRTEFYGYKNRVDEDVSLLRREEIGARVY